MSAKPLVIAGVTSAGLTYEPDTTPFTRLEFRKVPMGFPSAPSKKSRKLAERTRRLRAAFVAADTGEVSCFNDDGIVEVSCCSCDCTPLPVLALFACVTAEPCDGLGRWIRRLRRLG